MRKVYVSVCADFSPEGNITPLYLEWEDGHKYEIDRILDVRPGASLKVGGIGTRYTVMIRSKQSYMFLEDGSKWFVEGK